MADLKERLTELDQRATPGRWGQWNPRYMPEAEGTPAHEMDSSHECSALLPTGARYRLCRWTHARDAAFAEALVNAWREGRLAVVRGSTEEKTDAE